MDEQPYLGSGLGIVELSDNEFEPDLKAVLVALRHGNISEAHRLVEAIIQQNPKRAGAYYYRAHIWIAQKRLRRAMDDCNRAISFNPNFLDAYTLRGMLWLTSARHQSALKDFDKAIEINPNSSSGYLGRGMAFYQKGAYERRIHSFSGVMDNRYGWAEFQNALADFNHALEMNLQDKKQQLATAHWGIAFVYLAIGQFDQAILHANVTISIMPNQDGLLRERGTIYFKAGLYNEAIADFERALQLNPNNRITKNYYRQALNKKRNLGR